MGVYAQTPRGDRRRGRAGGTPFPPGPNPILEWEAPHGLAMPVGAAYQVATYQALLPAMDDPDRALFDGVDVRWVRRTLDCLEHGLDAAALEG